MLLLAELYERTDNVSIGKSLALLVKEDAEPMRVRRAAYTGLLIIRGLRLAEEVGGPYLHWRGQEHTFPEDADWGLVDKLSGG